MRIIYTYTTKAFFTNVGLFAIYRNGILHSQIIIIIAKIQLSVNCAHMFDIPMPDINYNVERISVL